MAEGANIQILKHGNTRTASPPCISVFPCFHICIALVLLCLALCSTPAHAGVETALEKLIGRQAATAFAQQYGTESDPVLVDWVQRVANRVTAVSPRKVVRYRVQVVMMDEPNAMALPGGYIFVTKGLLEFVQDDDELAGVLAHEVGHVAARHGMRQIHHQIVASLLITALEDKAGGLAGSAAGLLDALMVLGRSRHDEMSADILGAEYAARSGYDPGGLLSFLRKIQEPRKPSWLARLLATHPPGEERIARVKANPYVKDTPPEMLIAIGDRLASEYRYNRALQEYRAAASRMPNDTVLPARIARVLAVQGNRQQALAMGLRGSLPSMPPAEAHGPPPHPVSAEAEPARQAVLATLTDLNERQKQLGSASQRTYKALRRSWDRHEWTGRLETALMGIPGGLRTPWIYLAARCAILSADVDRLLRSTSRAMRLAPVAANQASSVCTLAARDPGTMGALPRELLSGIAGEMDRAGKESQESVAEAGRALPEIDEADRLLALVLGDLNSPYFIRSHWDAVGHLTLLEGFLDLATRAAGRADSHLSAANRDAARALSRAERAGIDLAVATASPEERAIFWGLVRTRLGVSEEALREALGHGVSLGDAAVMLLFTRSTAQPFARLEAARQGNATWIETAEKLGLPVDVQAIILRLLYNAITEERVSG